MESSLRHWITWSHHSVTVFHHWMVKPFVRWTIFRSKGAQKSTQHFGKRIGSWTTWYQLSAWTFAGANTKEFYSSKGQGADKTTFLTRFLSERATRRLLNICLFKVWSRTSVEFGVVTKLDAANRNKTINAELSSLGLFSGHGGPSACGQTDGVNDSNTGMERDAHETSSPNDDNSETKRCF